MPKGDCFEAAANLMVNMELKEATLVNGMVDGRGDLKGVRHVHAWVEINYIVLDYSNDSEVACIKDTYYNLGGINPLVKSEYRAYSYDEVIKLLIETEIYGPWHVGVK